MITVIAGDHGLALSYPESPHALRVIECPVELQRQMGGNAMIGRELWYFLNDTGFSGGAVSPRQVYADSSRPEYIEGVRNIIIISMVKGVRDQALAADMIDADSWERGIRVLNLTTDGNGSFACTFFKATGVKSR